jgi:uncharacterized protein (TIGR04255 family)
LFKRIQETYPEMEPGVEMGVEVQVGPGGIVQRLAPTRQTARFKHRTDPVLLQLAENTLSVHFLPRYPGWTVVRRVTLEAWSQARAVLQPAEIVRVGLRYVNRVEREFPEQKPGEWFRATDYIAPAILGSVPGFLSRVESRLDNQNRVIVTLGEGESTGSMRSLVFDIDRITERSVSPEDEAFGSEMDRLHEAAWDIFSTAKTDKLETLLNHGKK